MMSKSEHYRAVAVEGGAVPSLLCGHCHSTLPRARILRNDGERFQDFQCRTIGLCAADDCRAVNCCDDALTAFDNPEILFGLAS